MRDKALWHVGGVLWWMLKRLHPCGINVSPESLDFERIMREEGWL